MEVGWMKNIKQKQKRMKERTKNEIIDNKSLMAIPEQL